MKRTWLSLTKLNVKNLTVAAGILFVGYVLCSSIPDIRRYIRISTM